MANKGGSMVRWNDGVAGGEWIWALDGGWDMVNCFARFRHSFELPAVPKKSATICITADQSYRLWVNGERVARGPARGYQSTWPYDVVDIGPHLIRGRNVIAVRGYNPGRSNFQYLTAGVAGLAVAGQIGRTTLHTGTHWKAIRERGIVRGTAPLSLQLWDQEHFDARADSRLSGGDWTQTDFDDSTWDNACKSIFSAAGIEGVTPWLSLEPRGTPMMFERSGPPMRVLGIGAGKCAAGYRAARNTFELRAGEELGHKATFDAPGDGEWVTVPATSKDGFRSVLLDLGRLHTGNIRLEVQGAHGGEIVDLCHTEGIDEKKLAPIMAWPHGCYAAMSQRYVCARSPAQAHTFYHHLGFRFTTVTVRDSAVTIRLRVSLEYTAYPLSKPDGTFEGKFTSGDAVLDAIWKVSAWTQQCCSLDAYVDTPWREQAQWWGDARVQGWNTFYLTGDDRLLLRGIRQIGQQQLPNGLTYGHAPTMAHSCILPDFTLIWMLTMWDHYWQTGKTTAVREHWHKVQEALTYFDEQMDAKSGLLKFDRRYWLFLDWSTLSKAGRPAVYSLWWLLALQRLADLAKADGKLALGRKLSAKAGQVAKALGRLIRKDGTMGDGYGGDGKLLTSASVHAQTLALMTGLPVNERVILEDHLLPFIRQEVVPAAQPSAYWITYIFSVLSERGYGKEVAAHIRNRWEPMIAHGTTWENFEGRSGEMSFSHAWSAHPVFHLMQIFGGVRQTRPGWKAVEIDPLLLGTGTEICVPTPAGRLELGWKPIGQIGHRLWGVVPSGVRATVVAGDKRRLVKGRFKLTI